jgi:hypothetical protein
MPPICEQGDCEESIAQFKARNPDMLAVALSPTDSRTFALADQTISRHQPHELLNLPRFQFFDPRTAQEKAWREAT